MQNMHSSVDSNASLNLVLIELSRPGHIADSSKQQLKQVRTYYVYVLNNLNRNGCDVIVSYSHCVTVT